MNAAWDAVLFDIGGTLVVEAPPTTAVADLKVELYPGVLDGLAALSRRVRVGAVTNTTVMTEKDVRALLEPCGLNSLLEVVVTSVDIGVRKPDPAPIVTALSRLGVVDPARALFIGNHEDDQMAAARAGTSFRWVDRSNPIGQVLQELLDAASGSPS